jgi:hypothetical protein
LLCNTAIATPHVDAPPPCVTIGGDHLGRGAPRGAAGPLAEGREITPARRRRRGRAASILASPASPQAIEAIRKEVAAVLDVLTARSGDAGVRGALRVTIRPL